MPTKEFTKDGVDDKKRNRRHLLLESSTQAIAVTETDDRTQGFESENNKSKR